MALDTVITSPHRRSQAQNNAFASPSFTRQSSRANELGNFKTMVQRHRFLLTALALLVVLCTIYLYFAVTLGSRINSDSCSGLTGAEKALCHLQLAKDAMAMGKLKHFF